MRYLLLLVLAALLNGSAMADASLAMQRGCAGCHKPDAKMIGPAYRDIAERYRGDDGAVDRLLGRLETGGSGVWGTLAMPPSAASPEETRQLVEWILSAH